MLQTVGRTASDGCEDTPAWFFDRARFGGVLCDIASHQADQFRSSPVRRVPKSWRRRSATSIIRSLLFEDFGDVMMRGDRGTGYIRVDWFTPDGLATWGDGRLTILGTDGFIEIRKNIDIGGKAGGSHLFLVDNKNTRYIDCRDVPLP